MEILFEIRMQITRKETTLKIEVGMSQKKLLRKLRSTFCVSKILDVIIVVFLIRLKEYFISGQNSHIARVKLGKSNSTKQPTLRYTMYWPKLIIKFLQRFLI